MKNATNSVVASVRNDISREVKAAVSEAYSDIKGAVAKELREQVANVDIRSIRKDVIEKAAEKAAEKFDGDLEEILQKYNADLSNVSKIYSSIARSMSGRDDGREMTFRIG